MSDPKDLENEKTHTRNALHMNGYQGWLIDSVERKEAKVQLMYSTVYEIKCEDCEVSYVREIVRSLKATFQEHQRHDITSSEVSRQVIVNHHENSVKLNNARIYIVKPRWYERRVKEAKQICMVKLSFNKDNGRFNLI